MKLPTLLLFALATTTLAAPPATLPNTTATTNTTTTTAANNIDETPEARAPRAISPEVSPDKHVTFRLKAPKATEVSFTGEFQRGAIPMTKSPDGIFSATVGPIAPEIYNYNFTIDGVRTIDPGNQ